MALLFFENTACLGCGHELGYLPELRTLSALTPLEGGRYHALAVSSGAVYRKCIHYTREGVCNWMIADGEASELCSSCALTRTIPDLSVAGNQGRWLRLEAAKRRLVYGLSTLGLPVDPRSEQPGMLFDFLADTPNGHVLTGHEHGTITINVAEADDAVREQVRTTLGESYRTLLGHFRHETGHWFWERLIEQGGDIDAFRQAFGDERQDYAAAAQRHYAQGAPHDWHQRFISAYASMHPWEDWAETWAHYLHMVDTVEIGAQFGMSLSARPGPRPGTSRRVRLRDHNPSAFDSILEAWFPLTYAVNSLNRGMGLHDWYPFTLTDETIAKLRFVHECIQKRAEMSSKKVRN